MITTITLKIEGMECPNCALRIECIEGRLPGILRAEASYHLAQLRLEIDQTLVSIQQIAAEVARIGYKVVQVLESV